MPVNGFNFWGLGASDTVVIGSISPDITGNKAAYITRINNSTSPLYQVNVFDFTAGTPGGPSVFDLSPQPTFGTLLTPVMDANGIMWSIKVPASGVDNFHLQGWDSSTGSQIANATIPYTNSGSDLYTFDNNQSSAMLAFQLNGEAHIALWLEHDAPGGSDKIVLQFYNVDSGSPSDAGSITFPIDNVTFNDAMNLAFYCDGIATGYVMRINAASGNFSIPPSNGELIQIDMASLGQVSASFGGAYAFVGNPISGHINVITADGVIHEVDSSLDIVQSYSGLNNAWFTVVTSDMRMESYPGGLGAISYMMRNPRYGVSVDPATQQFLVCNGHSGAGNDEVYVVNRLVDYTVETTANCFADWGTAVHSFLIQQDVFLRAQQALMHSRFQIESGGGSPVTLDGDVWEFLFTPLGSPCSGVTTEFR